MKKTLSIFLAVALMTAILAGCAPAAAPAPAAPAEPAAPAAPSAEAPAASEEPAPADEPAVDPLHLIVAHCNPESHPYHTGLVAFKDYVEKESNGAITVELHASTLGTADNELIEKTMLGAIDMICASPAYLTQIGVPEVEFFSLMFLFDSMEHWEAVMLGGTGDKLAGILNEKIGGGARLVGYFTAGCRSYYGKAPMETMADFKGTKVRIQASEVQREVWEAAGAVPVVVAWGELYQALQQGVVDGAENDFTSCVSMDQHRTNNGKYMTLTEHDYGTRPLFFNGAKWDALTDAQREIIQAGIDLCEETQVKALVDLTADYEKRYIEEGGGSVTEFPEREAFKALGLPVQDRVCAELGLTEILEEVRSLSR